MGLFLQISHCSCCVTKLCLPRSWTAPSRSLQAGGTFHTRPPLLPRRPSSKLFLPLFWVAPSLYMRTSDAFRAVSVASAARVFTSVVSSPNLHCHLFIFRAPVSCPTTRADHTCHLWLSGCTFSIGAIASSQLVKTGRRIYAPTSLYVCPRQTSRGCCVF